MKREERTEFRGVSVGARVVVRTEDDMDHGRPGREKVVASISVCVWTPEEAARLHVPAEEVFWEFADRTLASHYARVEPAR